MKKIATFLGLPVLALFLVLWSGIATGQTLVTLQPDQSSLVPGQIVQVPVYVKSTFESADLYLSYDKAVLTPALPFVTALYTGFNAAATNAYYNSTTSYIGIIGSGTNVVFNIPTVLLTLQFIYNGGSTVIHLRKAPVDPAPVSKFYDELGDPLSVLYTDATMSGSGFLSVKSVTTGSALLWRSAATWQLMNGSAVPTGFMPTGNVNVSITGDIVKIDSNTTYPPSARDLIINPAGKLTVIAGKSLSVKGNMWIQGDATATGSFVDLANNTTVVGSTTVQRYTTGNWVGWPPTTITWHYISSPVSGATISSYAGSLLNEWKEDTLTNGYWKPLTLPLTRPLVPKKGYSAATPSNQVIVFTGGSLNSGNQSYTGLTNLHSKDTTGFNLIGNSFPSAVKWNSSVTRTNVDAAAYFYDGVTYITRLTTDASTYAIPAEQGFFVHVTAGFTSGSLTIPNANRVHSAGAYVKSSSSGELSLKVNGINLEDETSVRFNSDATEGFDSEYDAYKLFGFSNCPQIYSITANNKLSINSIPEMTAQTVVPIGLKAIVNDTYTITALGVESFSQEPDIYLEDLLLGKTQNLNLNPVYEFTAGPGGTAHRFNLRFSPVSGVGENTSNNIKIYSSENIVYVNIATDLHGEIVIYDLLGKQIKIQSIKGNSINRIDLNVESGYYLVKVIGDKSTSSEKVFIR
jgi:hypothetical protein